MDRCGRRILHLFGLGFMAVWASLLTVFLVVGVSSLGESLNVWNQWSNQMLQWELTAFQGEHGSGLIIRCVLLSVFLRTQMTVRPIAVVLRGKLFVGITLNGRLCQSGLQPNWKVSF